MARETGGTSSGRRAAVGVARLMYESERGKVVGCFSSAAVARARRVATVRRAQLLAPRFLADVTAAVSRRTGNRAHDFAVQMRHHLQSFLTGSVAALAFGYYRVHQDVWYAAEAVRQRR